jgi:NTE family protein
MSSSDRKPIDLALQGGGSHGAITWGVLDRLLADERLDIDGISGTSAGAMNAVVLADGLHRGGREGAREALANFWRAVSDAGRFSPIQRSLWDKWRGNFSLDRSPSYLFFESLTQLFTPRQLNPLQLNPLRDLLAKQVDFDRVNAPDSVKVYVAATSVRTGRAKVFRQPNLSVETVMASACLPFMYEAVKINGEAYWDGGYSGNPALYPLVDDHQCCDLLVVQINPLVREKLPETAREILNRVNEITFNSSLIKELRSIHLLHQLIEAEGLESERYRAMRLHLIHTEQEVQELSASSKLNTEWAYLTFLRDRGWQWADSWLHDNFEAIGQHSTFDLDALFEDSFRPLAAHAPKKGREDVAEVTKHSAESSTPRH